MANKSQLEARTYGIGELITQRKLFAVPGHQRSYAWGVEEVDQFLTDVANAIDQQSQDYFVGLIVLRGPLQRTWEILDGQQRLATTTMVYSSIRNWLSERSLDQDAKQIETEFIGVRQLGGRFSPRLQMNVDNRGDFDKYVVDKAPLEEMQRRHRELKRGSSNARLLEAAIACRTWVDTYAKRIQNSDTKEQSAVLFRLSQFLENGVKVVCVDVASDADAFTLFEVLNDRGADLSALDLVKNHIFGKIDEGEREAVESRWHALLSIIDAPNADEFLKVFWTSRYGVVQKNDVYRRIKGAFPEPSAVRNLVDDFVDAADKLRAIDDPDDDLWTQYPPAVTEFLSQIILIGSRQVRPVILAALYKVPREHLAQFMWLLVILLVRYQLIGRGRTGILEKTLGRLAVQIWNGKVAKAQDAWSEIDAILPNDVQFAESFRDHIESKPSRVKYLLAAINENLRTQGTARLSGIPVSKLLQDDVVIAPVRPRQGQMDLAVLDYALIERSLIGDAANAQWASRSERFRLSTYPLTKRLGADLTPNQALLPGHDPTLGDYYAFGSSSAVYTWPKLF